MKRSLLLLLAAICGVFTAAAQDLIVKTDSTKVEAKVIEITPENATVGGVTRNGDAIIATGQVQIQAGDNVVIFALPSAVKKVIKLFQK